MIARTNGSLFRCIAHWSRNISYSSLSHWGGFARQVTFPRARAIVADVRKIMTLSTPPPKQSPWLTLPLLSDPLVNRYYSLEENRVIPIIKQHTKSSSDHKNEMDGEPFCLGSCGHGWLFYSNRNDCALFLYNPISHRIIKLPSVDTLGEKRLHGYHFASTRYLILSSPPDEEGCMAMFVYRSSLGFCRPGHDAAWIPLGEQAYGQIAYSCKEKLFYGLKYQFSPGELDCWDLSDPSSPKRKLLAKLHDRWNLRPFPAETYYDWMWRFDDVCLRTYLLREAWCGDFILVIDRFMVVGSPYEGSPNEVTLFFEVFKVDLNNGAIQYVDDSLNDRALFVGSHSFSLPAQGSQHLRPNSIYFANYRSNVLTDHNLLYGVCDMGNFDYEHKVMERFNYPRDLKRAEPTLELRPRPVWFIPGLAS